MSSLINKIAKQISVSKKEVSSNLKKYINEIIVIKYGGSAMSDKKLSLNFFQNIKVLVDLDIKPIIVHGGGPQINVMLDKVNIKHKFFKGMRITDKKTFDSLLFAFNICRFVKSNAIVLVNKDTTIGTNIKEGFRRIRQGEKHLKNGKVVL